MLIAIAQSLLIQTKKKAHGKTPTNQISALLHTLNIQAIIRIVLEQVVILVERLGIFVIGTNNYKILCHCQIFIKYQHF